MVVRIDHRQIDVVCIQDKLAHVLEIDGDFVGEGGLNLPQTPVRLVRIDNKSAWNEIKVHLLSSSCLFPILCLLPQESTIGAAS
jgi:hypothetical protein